MIESGYQDDSSDDNCDDVDDRDSHFDDVRTDASDREDQYTRIWALVGDDEAANDCVHLARYSLDLRLTKNRRSSLVVCYEPSCAFCRGLRIYFSKDSTIIVSFQGPPPNRECSAGSIRLAIYKTRCMSLSRVSESFWHFVSSSCEDFASLLFEICI